MVRSGVDGLAFVVHACRGAFDARWRVARALALVAGAVIAAPAGAAWADSEPLGAPASPRPAYRDIVLKEAAEQNLPVDIADAVMAVESGYDPTVVGGVGEIGLMQVRPQTAEMLGFTGSPADLAAPAVNIHYGVTYLAGAWRQTGGRLCDALMKYRAGYGQSALTPLSVAYCQRANAHLLAAHSPFALTGPLPVATAPGAGPSHAGSTRAAAEPRIRTVAVSTAFWARKLAHIQAASRRIERKWSKLASD